MTITLRPPRALTARLADDDVLRGHTVYEGTPGIHLHGPGAIVSKRGAGGAVIPVQSPAAVAAGGAAPRVRLLPFTLATTGPALRNTLVLGPITGPALIDTFYGNFQGSAGATDADHADIFISDEPTTTLVNVARSNIPSGDLVWEYQQFADNNTAAVTSAMPGAPVFLGGTHLVQAPHPIKRIVLKPRFYLHVTCDAGGASRVDFDGWIRVVEGIDPDDFRGF